MPTGAKVVQVRSFFGESKQEDQLQDDTIDRETPRETETPGFSIASQ
jgi:hypothetical protein